MWSQREKGEQLLAVLGEHAKFCGYIGKRDPGPPLQKGFNDGTHNVNMEVKGNQWPMAALPLKDAEKISQIGNVAECGEKCKESVKEGSEARIETAGTTQHK